jgi:TP901 family phage tail tape measure protein
MSRNVVSIELIGKAGRLLRELDTSSNGVRKFGRVVKGEFAALRRAAGSLQGTLAGVGLSVGAAAITKQSALLDKELTQIGQTAGASKDQVKGLRKELFGMGKESGAQIEGLKDGFNRLVQAGLTWKSSLASTGAINIAGGVTGADPEILAKGLSVGAATFNIDLEKPGKAIELLDKMTVAGRLGNAELENLSDIFARVGGRAKSAGLQFGSTLAFLEVLSEVEQNPERLSTLADSTLRVFTNYQYMRKTQKATRVKFFDDAGARRDVTAVLSDIKTKFDAFKTDEQKSNFLGKVFGEMDTDTFKGMERLLGGSGISRIEEFAKAIEAAGGTLKRDFDEATSNLIDQTGRLKNTLREAADGFAAPIKDVLSKAIKYSLDKKEDGGLGLSGKQLLGGGLALAGGTALVARYGGTLAKRLLSRGGSVAGGIAEGKAIEAATGVTPVFITNWPAGGVAGGGGSLLGDLGASPGGKSILARLTGAGSAILGSASGVLGAGSLSAIGSMGAGAMATSGALVAAAGAAGYGVGSIINAGLDKYFPAIGDTIGEALNRIAAAFGNEESKRAIEMNIQIDEKGRVTTETNDPAIFANLRNQRDFRGGF